MVRMIVGGVMVFVWKYLIRPMAVSGAFMSCCPHSCWLCGNHYCQPCKQAPKQAVLEEYDAVTKELKNEK